MVTKRHVGCTPSPSWSTRGSLCPHVVFAWVPCSSRRSSRGSPRRPRSVPSRPPRIPALFSSSSRRRPLESGVGTWRCRRRGWSWSWPCGGRVVVVVDVEVVWAVEVVWVVEVVVNMVGGRRGGGRLGVVGVGDGRRRGGDRRGKVDAGGCRRVADVAWLGCGRCRVVDVARSTRGVVVVSSTWRGRHGGSSSCRRCGVVMVGMWPWLLSPHRRGKVDTGVVAWHGGRSSTWRSSSMGSSSSSTRRGGCRLPRRGVAGVVVVVDMAWGRRRPQPGLALGEHSRG